LPVGIGRAAPTCSHGSVVDSSWMARPQPIALHCS
jgi:hypothetical protein